MTAAEGKRIGYVDYDLNNYHSNVYLEHLRGELADRGYVVSGAWAMQEEASRPWAEERDLPYFDTCEELNEHVDFFMVLAPSRPETHLELCRRVFPFGKTTYVDKTFAPGVETARAIFDLADEHGIAMQTSSALRYCNVQDYVRELGEEQVRHMVTWGPGRSFAEYAVHPVELAVSCLGSEGADLMRRGEGDRSQLLVNFSGGRTLVVNVYANSQTPYAAAVTTEERTSLIEVDVGAIFLNMASAVLDLFDSGRPSIPREETMLIMRILEAARDPRALEGFVQL